MIEHIFGIETAYAHSGEEEEMGEISATDFAGPGLALLIIVGAIILSRRILKKKNV